MKGKDCADVMKSAKFVHKQLSVDRSVSSRPAPCLNRLLKAFRLNVDTIHIGVFRWQNISVRAEIRLQISRKRLWDGSTIQAKLVGNRVKSVSQQSKTV